MNMRALNVEQLIYALETFDAEQDVAIGRHNGRNCIIVGENRIPINLPLESTAL